MLSMQLGTLRFSETLVSHEQDQQQFYFAMCHTVLFWVQILKLVSSHAFAKSPVLVMSDKNLFKGANPGAM